MTAIRIGANQKIYTAERHSSRRRRRISGEYPEQDIIKTERIKASIIENIGYPDHIVPNPDGTEKWWYDCPECDAIAEEEKYNINPYLNAVSHRFKCKFSTGGLRNLLVAHKERGISKNNRTASQVKRISKSKVQEKIPVDFNYLSLIHI